MGLSGPQGELLRDRFFEYVDMDSNGEISVKEVVVTLSTLQRGTQEEVGRLFFDIFDLNGNSKLASEEII